MKPNKTCTKCGARNDCREGDHGSADGVEDKHWKSHLYGGSIESHTEFMLRGHKRIMKSHPSKKSLQNHIERLSIKAQAVPDLLEALQDALLWVDGSTKVKVRDAIAKATGEAQ